MNKSNLGSHTHTQIICGFAIVASSAALANASESAAQPISRSGGSVLESVVVTAQKREQSLNDVGLTVSAFSGDVLKEQNITRLDDIAALVPGLSYTTSASNAPVFTMRGVGFYDVTLGASPTVSVYVDQVPLPYSILTSNLQFDIERVEVMKGPQGTLFGQNSTGGAINFIAKKPTSEFTAGASYGFSRFDTHEFNAHVSGSLTDDLRARAATYLVNSGDWQKGYHGTSQSIGSRDVFAGRLLVDWSPADTLDLSLSLSGWRDKSDPLVPQVIGFQPQVDPNVLPAALEGYPLSPNKASAADFTESLRPFTDNDFFQVAVRADLDIGDSHALTSLTSVMESKIHQTQGGDGVSARILDVYDQVGDIEGVFQEIRISNDASSDLRYTIGANYEDSSADESSFITFQDSSAYEFYAIEIGKYETQVGMKAAAVFTDIEKDINDFVTIKGGIRYTEAERDYFTCYEDPGVGSPPLYPTGEFFYALSQAFGNSLAAYQPGECFVLDNITSDASPADFMPGSFSDKLEEENTSWRFGVDGRDKGDRLYYANISKGYKVGSYPAVSASVQSSYLPVVQESVLAYEVGLKASAFEQRAQVNVAAFYYDYQDKQLRTKIIDPVFGIVDALVNIPESKARGVEIEVQAVPIDGLTISGAFIFLDSEIKEYVGVNAGGVEGDFSGADVPFSPERQATLTVDYDFPITSTLSGFIGSSLKHSSKATSIVGFSESKYAIDSYTLVDLRAGMRTNDDRWHFQVWGKNVTDEYYWTNIVASYDTLTRYPGLVATYGATISYEY